MSDKPNLADQLGIQTVRPQEEADLLDKNRQESRPLYKNPYVKVGIALAFIFFSIGFASLFLIVGNSNEELAEPGARQVEGDVSPLSLTLDSPQENLAPGEASSAEIQRLRAQNALLEQQLAMAEIDRNLRPPQDSFTDSSLSREPTSPEVGPTSSPQRMPPARIVPPPATPATSPVSSVRPSRTTSAPVSPPPVVTSSRPRTPSIPLEPVDPNETWERLATSGMYGMMLASSGDPTSSSESPQESPLPVSIANVPGLLSPSLQRKVPMGQRVAAQTTAPIAWLEAETQHRIRLSAEIVFDNGEVAVPEGAFLIAQTASINESNGLGQLIVTGFQIDDDFTPLPSDLIVVNGAAGNPLIANRFGDPGPEIASGDIELFAIGALGRVGQVINRPDSQVITTGTFGSTVSTDNGDSDILAAVLEGGADQISDRLDERNEDRLDELLDRDVIFYLPEEMQLEIYISGDFSL